MSVTRVFVAQLAGTPVFDPAGDSVGRVRDVVVMLRVPRLAPRVIGLVVEIAGRRRVFLAMTRVTRIDAGQVVTTGLLNVRRFHRRPAETLVIAEMLDRSVTIERSGEQATVFDIGMERTRTRDWLVTKVAVLTGARTGRGFRVWRTVERRRRGNSLVLDWDEVSGAARELPGQSAGRLLATLDTMRAADLARVLQDLSEKRRSEVAAELDDTRLAEVLEELPEADQIQILGALDTQRAAVVVEEMEPDDAADLIAELPDETAEQLLARMEPKEAEGVRRLLRYDDDTAGGLMTSEPLVLAADATVAEALAAARAVEVTPALAAMVYVSRPPLETPTGKFLGVAHIQRLLREPPSTLVSGVLDDDLEALRPAATLQEVAAYFARYDLVAAPVVDDAGHLVGAVTVDDVLDHLLPRGWREREHLGPDHPEGSNHPEGSDHPEGSEGSGAEVRDAR